MPVSVVHHSGLPQRCVGIEVVHDTMDHRFTLVFHQVDS